MLKFPDNIIIRIVDGFTDNPIRTPNIIVSIHFFAIRKNDYYLGPFFSDDNGEIRIDKNILEISAEAELQTGLMDYKGVGECSSLVEIKIASEGEIANLIKGRTLWGLVGQEQQLYNTKEELLDRITKNNNNLIFPNSLRVIWNKDTPSEFFCKISTRSSEKRRKGSDIESRK